MKPIARIITTTKRTDEVSSSERILEESYVDGLPVMKDEHYVEIDGNNSFHVRYTYRYGEKGERSCYERVELDLVSGEVVENEYNCTSFFYVEDNMDLHVNGSLYGGHTITTYYPETDVVADVIVRDKYGRVVSHYTRDIDLFFDDCDDEESITEFYDDLGRVVDVYDHDSCMYSHFEYVKKGLNEGRIIKTDYTLVGEDNIPEAVGINVVGSILFDLQGNEIQISMEDMVVDYEYDSFGLLIRRIKNEVYNDVQTVTTEEFFYE